MSAHITLYHKNDTNFRITRDLHNTCSVLYRTYSVYKSPISRHHSNRFHSTEKPKNNLNRISVDSQQQKKIDSDVGHVFINNDDNNTSNSADDELELILSDDDQETMFYKFSSSFSSTDDEETLESMMDVKRVFVSFILQSRENFLWSKDVMKIICNCIVTSLNHIQILLEKKTLYHSKSHGSSHGGRTEDSLLVKLNLDDIGWTNSLESSGDQHKFCIFPLKISLINIDLKLIIFD